MNIMDTMVTDRTYSDVKRAIYLESLWSPDGTWTGTQAEYDECVGDLRGEYRAPTLNRVEDAVAYVADLLRARGFAVDIEPRGSDWEMPDVPDYAQMTRYLTNLRAIRGAVPVYDTTPAVPPDMDLLTYQDANNIEKLLRDVYEICLNISKTWVYSGQVTSGMWPY